MAKRVIIVESPAKAKTISSYVGNDMLVMSSVGHVRDLATTGKDGLGIDINNDFNPQYIIIKGKEKIVKDLIKKTKDKQVLLATDPDREGEAIAWHLAEILSLNSKDRNRIEFSEITKSAVIEALKNARAIDQNLVNSQEARRIIDRIIGFKLSKLLQSKIKSKSAGRVQSVALKLIVDLEREIEDFIKEIYYEIEATFPHFKAEYIIPAKKRLDKEEAEKIVIESKNPFEVKDIIVKENKRDAKPSFITSTMQQDAISHLNMSARRVMSIAQSLYEGKEINGEIIGLITYMRTDSTRVSQQFINEAENYIKENFGSNYLGKYRSRKSAQAQDAHEAIRPTSLKRTPESLEPFLSREELRLYKRIYQRSVASLMTPAIFENTKVILESDKHEYQAFGIKQLFLGHLAMYQESKHKDSRLPHLTVGQKIDADEVVSVEKETKPKTRYSEATLIKELETSGIGRPSTYAHILQTLKERRYVEMVEKRFKPTDQGKLTSDQLDLFFSQIINVKYTSEMEAALDKIAIDGNSGVELVSKFYHDFVPKVEKAQKEMKKIEPKMTDEICPVCGRPLVVRTSKYGEFIACSGFPSCKYIKKEE